MVIVVVGAGPAAPTPMAADARKPAPADSVSATASMRSVLLRGIMLM